MVLLHVHKTLIRSRPGILHRKDMTPPPYLTKAQIVSIFIEENSVFDCQILK